MGVIRVLTTCLLAFWASQALALEPRDLSAPEGPTASAAGSPGPGAGGSAGGPSGAVVLVGLSKDGASEHPGGGAEGAPLSGEPLASGPGGSDRAPRAQAEPPGGLDAALVEAPVVDAAGLDAALVEAPVVDAAGLDAALVEAPVVVAAGLDAAFVEAPGVEAAAVEGAGVEAAAAGEAGVESPVAGAAGVEAGAAGAAVVNGAEAERQRAYEASLAELLPSSPDEIRGWRAALDARIEALGDSPLGAMRTRTELVRLEPGFKPPVVELTPNLVTALIFMDRDGSPWPIASSALGSASLFRAEVLGGESASQIIVSPLGDHGQSNLIVTLRGRDVPLVIELVASSSIRKGREVDALIMFQVRDSRAGAEEASASGSHQSAAAVDEALYAVLDGLIPPGGRALPARPALEGEGVWAAGGTMYLRTRRSLVWPPFRAKVAGPGGLSVYELRPSTVISLASGDEITELSVPGADTTPSIYREAKK